MHLRHSLGAAVGILLLMAPLAAAQKAPARKTPKKTTSQPAIQPSTVDVSLHDGRVSIRAKNATPRQILAAWSEAGHTTIINGDTVPGGPVTIEITDAPEGDALNVVLRSAGGYLALSRSAVPIDGSIFERILIMPASQAPRSPSLAASASTLRVAPTRAGFPTAAAAGIPIAPGVTRLVGDDGQPLEDDQEDAPPPSATVSTPSTPNAPAPSPIYSGGDPPPPAPTGPRMAVSPGSVPPALGSSAPGLPVAPEPSSPRQ